MTLTDLQAWLEQHGAHCHIQSRVGRFVCRISKGPDWSERQNEDLELAVQDCMDAFLGTFAEVRHMDRVADGGTAWNR